MRLLANDLGPVDGRDISDIYWEHIFLRCLGKIALDIKRNYSEQLVLTLWNPLRNTRVPSSFHCATRIFRSDGAPWISYTACVMLITQM